MLYISRNVKLVVSEDRNSGYLIWRSGRDIKFEDLLALSEAKLTKQIISLPATDRDLLQGTSISVVKILYIETDTELLVKLESTGDTGFKVKPIDSSDLTKKGTLYLEGDFSHVYVTPTGTTGDATVLMGVVGT